MKLWIASALLIGSATLLSAPASRDRMRRAAMEPKTRNFSDIGSSYSPGRQKAGEAEDGIFSRKGSYAGSGRHASVCQDKMLFFLIKYRCPCDRFLQSGSHLDILTP